MKLLEHAMNMVERIFEYRSQQQIDMQFGFVKGKGTDDSIFIVRRTPRAHARTHTHTQTQ